MKLGRLGVWYSADKHADASHVAAQSTHFSTFVPVIPNLEQTQDAGPDAGAPVDAGAPGDGTLFDAEMPYVMLRMGDAIKLVDPGRFEPAKTGGWLESVTLAAEVLIQPPGCWPATVTVVRSSGTCATGTKVEFGCEVLPVALYKPGPLKLESRFRLACSWSCWLE